MSFWQREGTWEEEEEEEEEVEMDTVSIPSHFYAGRRNVFLLFDLTLNRPTSTTLTTRTCKQIFAL